MVSLYDYGLNERDLLQLDQTCRVVEELLDDRLLDSQDKLYTLLLT